jgi:BolA family transcriptional regulator, general stress-responsive regulator
MGSMTDPATAPALSPNAPMQHQIVARLVPALAPTHLEVVNESAQHRGHAGDDGTGETHFLVVVESDAFAGVSRVERQRMINRALAGLLPERIHALAIVARAPGEAR